MDPIIRPITEKDDPQMERIVRDCLVEFGGDHEGTAWEDPDLGCLSRSHADGRSRYWVAEDGTGRVLGGVGIAPWPGSQDTCELQKMYCIPEVRGTGVAEELLSRALTFAAAHYGRCYLETFSSMTRARRFYERHGFHEIDYPLPGTAHGACDVFLVRELPDFDRVIDRHGRYSVKFDGAQAMGLPADVLPLWIADMDFQTAEPIRAALHQAVDHGIFGYSQVDDDYLGSACRWFAQRHGWEPDPGWVVLTAGVVHGLSQCIRALTEPGDAVVIQPPVYHPFSTMVERNGRRLVENPLVLEDGRYTMDLVGLERVVVEEDARALILCSPHNPVGRVWEREELEGLAEICAAHDVLVLADEIHCDLILPGHHHTMFGEVARATDLRWLSATAPSKTFNLAGLQVSHLFVPDPAMREGLGEAMIADGYGCPNTLGLVAAKAAYDHGTEWLDQCRAYLADNLDFLRRFLAERLPMVRLVEPEGTYFAWVDLSALGLDDEALDDLIVDRARLWLDGGRLFGRGGSGFQRIVLACPRATLERALLQLERAIRG